MKNYSLIAQQWSDFFANPDTIQKFLNDISPVLQKALETFTSEMMSLYFKDIEENEKDLCRYFVIEAFLAGLVLWSYEENIDLVGQRDVSVEKVTHFFTLLDDKESLGTAFDAFDIVSEALLSRAATQIGNKYLFANGEPESFLYTDFAQKENHFFFSCLCGYIMGREVFGVV